MSKSNTDVSQYFTEDIPADLKEIVLKAVDGDYDEKQLIKSGLLKEAETKEPHFFHQFDGFADSEADCVFSPDEDKDALFSCNTWELKNCTNDVRVLIHEDAKPEDAIRLLKKIRNWIKNNMGSALNKSNRQFIANQLKPGESIPADGIDF